MGLSTTFTLKFDGDKVKRGLSSVGKQLKSLGSAAMGIAKAGAAVVAFGIGAAAGIAAVALKLNSVGEAANTSEKRLKNIIDSMDLFGSKSDDVADRLNDLADAQGRMIGEDNKIIRLTQSKLMTFKELAQTADQAGGAFDRATMAALDMAGAGFGTAEMNAVQLGKALNDPIKGITALARSGITFTEQEKEKIKTLVESNRMLEAQDMILKAIEKQIGGTAAATADGSKKMAESASQILQAFSKPFSEGFNSIPGMLENVFPKIKAKAEELGFLFGTAISEAVNGDSQRLMMIGSLIGDLIKKGAELSVRGISDSLGQQFIENIEGQKFNVLGAISRHYGGAEKHRLGAEYGMKNAWGSASSEIMQKYDAALSMAPRGGSQGAIPQAEGNRIYYRNEDGQLMTRMAKTLDSIDSRLAPQP
jgi:hypothetical protein